MGMQLSGRVHANYSSRDRWGGLESGQSVRSVVCFCLPVCLSVCLVCLCFRVSEFLCFVKFGVDLSRLVGESARSGVGRQGIAGTHKRKKKGGTRAAVVPGWPVGFGCLQLI